MYWSTSAVGNGTMPTAINSMRLRYRNLRSTRVQCSSSVWWLTQMIPIVRKLTRCAAYANDAIYQIEFSLNCNDRNSSFCTQVVGLGGLWGWIAVGNDGFADVEATFCGHGFPLAPHGGAGHISADIPWSYSSTPGEFPWIDPNGQYV